MKQKVIITKICWLHQEYLATALYQDWKLMEINLEAIDKQSILGNIYVGRVKNIVKNLNAAFIEIAPGLPCYYPMDNIQSPLYVKKANSLNLVQGDEVVVQVIRESTGKKPPKVSTNLNLTGKYLVLTSENTTLGISRKLSQEVRENLKKNLIFEENSDFGIIVRTNASNASTEEILVEYEQLKQEYFSIKDAAPHQIGRAHV